MTEKEKLARITKLTYDYLKGMITSEESLNAIVLIIQSPTTEEFYQR